MSVEITSLSTCGAILLYELLHIPATEVGNIVGDYLRSFRLNNLEKINQKHQKMLEERSLTKDDLKTIEPKFGIPVLDAASLETNDVLQSIWAKLITNAADPNFTREIRVAFINVLKTFTPVEVGILSFCNKRINFNKDVSPYSRFTITIVRSVLLQELNIDDTTCNIAIGNLERCQIFKRNPLIVEPDKKIIVNLTTFGAAFIDACISDSFTHYVSVLDI